MKSTASHYLLGWHTGQTVLNKNRFSFSATFQMISKVIYCVMARAKGSLIGSHCAMGWGDQFSTLLSIRRIFSDVTPDAQPEPQCDHSPQRNTQDMICPVTSGETTISERFIAEHKILYLSSSGLYRALVESKHSPRPPQERCACVRK